MKPRLWSKPFFLIILITFLFFLSLHMLNASFPVYITQLTHKPALGGTMTTAFMLASIFTRPLVSIFLPRIKIKKTICITLLFIIVSIALSYGNSSYSFIILLRIFEGIGFGIITTLLATLATTTVPTSRLGEGVGYFGMATSLGASFAPFAGLAVLHAFNFNMVLTLSLIIILIIAACSFYVKNLEINHTGEKPSKNNNSSIVYYIFDKKALFPSILVFLLCVTFTGVFNFIDGLGEETGLGASISIYFLVFMIMMIFIRPVSGRLYDKVGHKRLIIPAGLSGMIGLLLLSIINSLWLLILAAVFFGTAYGTLQPTLQSWAVSQVSSNKKGTANAMILTGMDLGMAVGAPVLGFTAGKIGYQAMFGLSSIFILILVVLFLVNSNLSKKAASGIGKENSGFSSGG